MNLGGLVGTPAAILAGFLWHGGLEVGRNVRLSVTGGAEAHVAV